MYVIRNARICCETKPPDCINLRTENDIIPNAQTTEVKGDGSKVEVRLTDASGNIHRTGYIFVQIIRCQQYWKAQRNGCDTIDGNETTRRRGSVISHGSARSSSPSAMLPLSADYPIAFKPAGEARSTVIAYCHKRRILRQVLRMARRRGIFITNAQPATAAITPRRELDERN